MNSLLILFVSLLVNVSFAQVGRVVLEPIYDELEGLPLAEKLLDDGQLDLAIQVIKSQKNSSKKTNLWARYLNDNGQPQKVSELISEGFELARSYYLMNDWENCAFVKIENSQSLSPSNLRILIDCHLKSLKFETAWNLINLS
jgi:hypothetical protein